LDFDGTWTLDGSPEFFAWASKHFFVGVIWGLRSEQEGM
jgi:hypothetical protein